MVQELVLETDFRLINYLDWWLFCTRKGIGVENLPCNRPPTTTQKQIVAYQEYLFFVAVSHLICVSSVAFPIHEALANILFCGRVVYLFRPTQPAVKLSFSGVVVRLGQLSIPRVNQFYSAYIGNHCLLMHIQSNITLIRNN